MDLNPKLSMNMLLALITSHVYQVDLRMIICTNHQPHKTWFLISILQNSGLKALAAHQVIIIKIGRVPQCLLPVMCGVLMCLLKITNINGHPTLLRTLTSFPLNPEVSGQCHHITIHRRQVTILEAMVDRAQMKFLRPDLVSEEELLETNMGTVGVVLGSLQ
jgi:energy-converting hydrogenase Eha subunit A